MIRFHDVCFAYPGERGSSSADQVSTVLVLDHLSFEAADGAVVWLDGANGTGKSTIIHLALGLLTPTSGIVETTSGNVSAVFQEDRLCDHLTAVANVRLGLGRPTDTAQIMAELIAAGLPPEEAHRPVAQLSGGQRRRVGLVRALMRPSNLLCLDEPYTGIDQSSLESLIDYTQSRLSNRTVLLTCHDPAVAARFAPQVVNLSGLDPR